MRHLGDITKLDGATIEPVWCVTGGSPCQDLSIAGKRAGLAGARSGLFMEQIRVIKEMREHDRQLGRSGELIRPRYMVWENVPGALSSNKGRDFAAVLEETIRLVEPEAPSIEVPAKGWPTWGGVSERGRKMERGLASTQRGILGSAPASSSDRACRRFWRRHRTRNTI